MINSISIALSGLESATKKLQATASNIANMQTVGSLEPGGTPPYTPITTQQTAQEDGGVRTEYVARNNPFSSAYMPGSPFADDNGVVGVPNVDLAEEAVNMTLAKTTYKANVGVLNAQKEMSDELLSIFDEKV
jgi:flagellar basal-body rod protein FlgC